MYYINFFCFILLGTYSDKLNPSEFQENDEHPKAYLLRYTGEDERVQKIFKGKSLDGYYIKQKLFHGGAPYYMKQKPCKIQYDLYRKNDTTWTISVYEDTLVDVMYQLGNNPTPLQYFPWKMKIGSEYEYVRGNVLRPVFGDIVAMSSTVSEAPDFS